MANYIYLEIVLFKNKECNNCRNKGHKFSHCRKKLKSKTKNKNLVRCIIEQKAVETLKRKYINVQLNNKKVKFQLDTGSDLTIINAETWKRINRLTLITSKKIARGVTGGKSKFLDETVTNVFYFSRKERKLNTFVMERSQNLFGTDWMDVGWLFGFYGISTFADYLMPNPFLCK